MRKRCAAVTLLVALAGLGSGSSATSDAGPVAPERQAAEEKGPYANLEYRSIGPAVGGRLSRVAGIPGDPLTYFAAASAGGVWKSLDGGLAWKPVFDEQPVSSIGSIAIAPSDPNVVYVGAGEANIRGNVAEGNGIYRSTDGGETWRHVWKAEGQIGTMEVHPRDPDVAWAAVLGSPFGPSPERGVYRTLNGGETWERVLFRDADTGASDVALDPGNPRKVFAGLWQARRTPWGLTSGGPGSGFFVSKDAGATWTELRGKGLPEGEWGKVGVRVAPADSSRVYALIEAEEGGLFRSDDGGGSWERVNASRALRQRAWYYTTLTVDPTDADTVWFHQVPMLKTVDGGRTIQNVEGGGWDYHDVWIDPADPRRMIVGSDAGVSLSRDGGGTWVRPPLPIGQFYHLTTDRRTPYRVLGSLQDWGTTSGPSNSLHGGGIFVSDWHSVGGGEAGWVATDPAFPDHVWAGEYLGYISRWDGRTGRVSHVGIYPDNGSGHGAEDLRYRFQWTAPIVISPHDPKTVYHAANVLFRTRDGGQSWEAMSGDLTRDDPTKQKWSGGPITGDNTGVEFYGTIFAVAESPVAPGVIWAGTDDGLVQVTRDAGGSWAEVTPEGMPEWATVSAIEPSRREAGVAYVVADAHRLDDERPYLWKTTDFGASWTSLATGLDPEVYLHVVREDPERAGVLYLGSERGVLVSRDDGASWQPLKLNLPTVAVVDLAVTAGDLVVGTLGRSAWILDDLTPVREGPPDSAAVRLLPPPPAIAWHYASEPAGSDAGAGENPPRGALFTYHLAAAPAAGEEVVVEVLDGGGGVIRHLSSKPDPVPFGPGDPDWWPGGKIEPELPAAAGLNRAAWDLRHEGAKQVAGTKIDIGDPASGPPAVPGRYTLRLTAGGVTVEQPLEVRPDPREGIPEPDRREQLAFNLELRDRMTEIAELVEAIRAVREQLAARGELADAGGGGELAELGGTILERFAAIEEALHNPHAEVAYDVLAGRHGGAKLYSRYSWLYEGASEHAGPPTQGMKEIAAALGAELAAERRAFEELVAGELAALNARARERGVPYVTPPS